MTIDGKNSHNIKNPKKLDAYMNIV